MKFRYLTALALSAGLASFGIQGAYALTPEEAQAIATDAYVYFYPLVTMDVTRKQSTNVEKVETTQGPPNAFVNVPSYPPADFKTVVRPNFDTLYSSAMLDLTEEPVVISVPDTDGRYYLLPMLDMWTDVFASPGWRTTGTGAQTLLITPPGWEANDALDEIAGLPDDTRHIAATTPYVWIIGRIKTDGPADYPAVNKIQDALKLVPLSHYGEAWTVPAGTVDPEIDMKTPPKAQVDAMSGEDYFAYAAELLKVNPPHDTDQPIIDRLERLGFERGQSFDYASADPVVQKAIDQAPKAAMDMMEWETPRMADVANGWSMNVNTVGVYGNDYLKRAVMTNVGLGANQPKDAIYPLSVGDKDGKPLDGTNDYVMHFEKSDIPPVDAFWSVTLYDEDGYQVANSLNRFALSNWMPFVKNEDGSLDLYFQNESPGKDKEANWLPAPKGPFTLTMRLYVPKSDALTGKWAPPAITKAE